MSINFFNFGSKSFWLGAIMIVAGALAGLDIPLITDVVTGIWPTMTAGQLITAGFALIFLRDAIAKSSA